MISQILQLKIRQQSTSPFNLFHFALIYQIPTLFTHLTIVNLLLLLQILQILMLLLILLLLILLLLLLILLLLLLLRLALNLLRLRLISTPNFSIPPSFTLFSFLKTHNQSIPISLSLPNNFLI